MGFIVEDAWAYFLRWFSMVRKNEDVPHAIVGDSWLQGAIKDVRQEIQLLRDRLDDSYT